MTEAQLTANRENAKLSTGPRTPEGRKRSSLNAFRHGLTGQIIMHTPEDEQAFKKHCDGIREALAPVGALELDLAQAIAEDRWRLNRARALENSIFALGQGEHLLEDSGYHPEVDTAFAQGRTWMTHAHELHLLTTYENRIRRAVEKNTAELHALQAERKAAVAKAEEEARLLVQLAEAEGGDYDPADDFPAESQPAGFVFSRAAIQRQIDRNRRIGRALGLLNQSADSNQQGPRHRATLRVIEKQAAATQN
ncbi:MAG TPA: hypothetical protein VIY49_01965 [Bryobacteraceae bacterium]